MEKKLRKAKEIRFKCYTRFYFKGWGRFPSCPPGLPLNFASAIEAYLIEDGKVTRPVKPSSLPLLVSLTTSTLMKSMRGLPGSSFK